MEFSSKVKLVIFLLIVAAGIYIGWNMIPPYFNKAQFQDDLDEIVRRTTYNPLPEDQVKAIVVRTALARDIHIQENQISLTHAGPTVAITVHYSVHVDMIVHPVDLDFTVDSHNKIIGT